MLKKIKRLFRRRKAVSPVVATILLIALVVAASAVVYLIYIRLLRKSNLEVELILVRDSDKDSLYDEITLQLANTGTRTTEIYNLTIWTTPASGLGNENLWVAHTGWEFENENEKTINPSEIVDADITGDSQIELTVSEYTYYRLEYEYTGSSNVHFTDWDLLNEFADLSDILITFDTFNLTAFGFDGTIDDPSRAANNYLTPGVLDTFLVGSVYEEINTSLIPGFTKALPVLNESELIPFTIEDRIVVFHSTNGNLTSQPLVQTFDRSSNPFRATKFFVLGLAGSWGDEFSSSDFSLNLTFVYTDDSVETHLLDHDFIDDWWYGANPGGDCISAPSGLITEIDLGDQSDTPHSHIHTHTTRFYFDYFKYVKSIIFTDPGDDASASHIIALTVR